MKICKPSHLVTVVIPIYKATFTEAEKRSFQQCIRVLAGYPVKIVKPESLDLDELHASYPDIELMSFEDKYFKGVDSYNELMTSLFFYERFTAFEYMLIYQLDAFVFRDELTAWCKKGFDYIGSPTLHQESFDSFSADAKEGYGAALSSRRVVLNGGLSLRRVRSFIKYLKIYNTFYPAWKGNEDMLFSQEATRLLPMKLFMKLPTWQEALHFAFEKSPAASFALTDRKLPFGCHAWERYDPAFWKDYIDLK